MKYLAIVYLSYFFIYVLFMTLSKRSKLLEKLLVSERKAIPI